MPASCEQRVRSYDKLRQPSRRSVNLEQGAMPLAHRTTSAPILGGHLAIPAGNLIDGAMPSFASQTATEAELASLIVTTLNLEAPAASIDPELPLYKEGLGLDSIDMLEVSLVVAQRYGVKLRADDENNASIFGSLRSLSAYIQAQRVTE
jgi:acyl carrier protein